MAGLRLCHGMRLQACCGELDSLGPWHQSSYQVSTRFLGFHITRDGKQASSQLPEQQNPWLYSCCQGEVGKGTLRSACM